MSGEKVPWLEPDSILDSGFLRQLYDYHDFDTLTFDNFSHTLHDAGHDEVQDALRPFIKQLASVQGFDGKPAKKVKHKARALLMRKPDVKALVDVFGQRFKNRKAIQTFIERAKPEEVATALRTAASSDLAKELPNEVQIILRNRISLNIARSSSSQESVIGAPEDSSEEALVSVDRAVTQPAQSFIDFLQSFDPQKVIQDYSSTVNDMPPPQSTSRKRGRPRKSVEASSGGSISPNAPPSVTKESSRPKKLAVVQSATTDAREAYPSPPSPLLSSSLPATMNMVLTSSIAEEATISTAGTEAKPSKATKKRKHASALDLDGQADLYDLPVSSPSSKASDAMHMQTVLKQESTPLPSQKTKKVNGVSPAKLSKSQKPMSEAEDLLLKESLGLIPKTSNSVRPTKDTRSASRQSTPKSVRSSSSEEEDLLRECLKSTSRKAENELSQASLKSASEKAEDDLLQACLKSTSRKSSEKLQVPVQLVAASQTESGQSQKAQPAPISTSVIDDSTPGKSSKKKMKSRRGSSVASMSNATDPSDPSNQFTSLSKQPEPKTAHNHLARTSALPAEKANKSSKIAKRAANSDVESLQRVASPELSFTPLSKNVLKRKRKSFEQDAYMDEGDTLEVDESVYNSEGNRMEQSPTVKVTKKKEQKKKKPKHEDSVCPSASLMAEAPALPNAKPKQHKEGGISQTQPKSTNSPNLFGGPMNCSSM
jgi:hypothetical protein